MIIFDNPQDPFINQEFTKILMDYVKIKYINDCPTFHGKTFFWSTSFYPNIRRQYLLNKGDDTRELNKLFFLKKPESYQDSYSKYSKNFRNAVNKSRKNNLALEVIDSPSIDIIDKCYALYQKRMDVIRTFSFSESFFQKVCRLSYSSLWVVKRNEKIVSFALMLGNLMFIQSSNHFGKELCANNFLYDQILKKMANNYIFFGIASKNNSGLFKFKVDAGLDNWSTSETKFDIFQHLPSWLLNNVFAWFFLKFINKDKLIKYRLPY